jgi:hypothetical protein
MTQYRPKYVYDYHYTRNEIPHTFDFNLDNLDFSITGECGGNVRSSDLNLENSFRLEAGDSEFTVEVKRRTTELDNNLKNEWNAYMKFHKPTSTKSLNPWQYSTQVHEQACNEQTKHIMQYAFKLDNPRACDILWECVPLYTSNLNLEDVSKMLLGGTDPVIFLYYFTKDGNHASSIFYTDNYIYRISFYTS